MFRLIRVSKTPNKKHIITIFIIDCFVETLKNDVVSRMIGDPSYKGSIDCFVETLKNDGPLAFYKGFISTSRRLDSRNVIMFLTWSRLEQFDKYPKLCSVKNNVTSTSNGIEVSPCVTNNKIVSLLMVLKTLLLPKTKYKISLEKP